MTARTLFLISTLAASAGPRVANTTITLPPNPPASVIEVENAFPGLSFSQPLCLRSPEGETRRLFVCEKSGDLEVIGDVTSASPSKSVFLDLDQILASRGESLLTGSEQGLLSVAFHPDYETNGQFFIVYNVRSAGVSYQRLSRWTDPVVTDLTADADSEQVFLEMRNDAGNHNGGDLHFGPDGYLYMSWGDEGRANDSLNNSQYLDKDFWSSVTRIDVDLEPEDGTASDGTGSDDANLPPNAHPAVKLADGKARYEIPADNPWVGATRFNGVAVDPGKVRTEFFAVGLRNPWRMSFDRGELWIGDVGQGAREEVTIATPGSNHGWAWYEGFLNGPKFNNTINGASRTGGTFTDPVYDYTRGSAEFQGRSITGGFVYRGDNLPALTGKYIFGDYVSGNIWALARSGPPGEPEVERIAGEGGIAAFGPDPSNGDILLADLGDGAIRRLVARDVDPTFPETLTETGIFSDLEDLTPHAGVVPYDVNLPFWSDHAVKRRWFALKNTTDLINYRLHEPWQFPGGMIWVKHFDLELERGNPASQKRIETRVIVKTEDPESIYGVSYRWNEAGTEASLVGNAGENFDLEVTTAEGVRKQTWTIPSRAACHACHTPEAGFALSFDTPQLNHDGEIEGSGGNLLALLFSSGYLDQDPGDPAALPRHLGPEEDKYSLEARVRSYLDVNCAYCHQDQGVEPQSWEGDFELTMAQTGLINGMAAGDLQDPADRLVVPGNPNDSIVLSRVAGSNGYARMPPLATNELDEANIELLTEWINKEATDEVTYGDWRKARFGDVTSPGGDPQADPDFDRYDNFSEWLARTDPREARDFPATILRKNGDALEIDLPGLADRRVVVERSTDLSHWLRWAVPGNDGIPRNPAHGPHLLSAPAKDEGEYFRFRIDVR